MVRQGDAVSLIHPDEVRVELARGEFVPLEFGAPPLTFHTGLVWLADRSRCMAKFTVPLGLKTAEADSDRPAK
jgi:hypothetical protein